MTGFFEYSQKIKEEIQLEDKLMKSVMEYLSGDKSRPHKFGSHKHFSLGQTESGLYLILRTSAKETDFNEQIITFEKYCQVAEYSIDRKEGKTVSFAIGVVYKNNIAGVIAEDLSEKGAIKIHQILDVAQRSKDGKNLDVVCLDLDNMWATIFGSVEPQSKYFLPENRIDLPLKKK